MQSLKPFAIYRPTPGQRSPQPLVTGFAYSIEQAKTVAAAMIAGETIVVPVQEPRR